MAITVGYIPYLSCEPFYFAATLREIATLDMPPSAIADALTQGTIMAGPVPLPDCFRLEEQCKYISGFCVAMIRKANSILLHSQQPIEALADAHIALPAESGTASRLLQILLALKYQVHVGAYVSPAEEHTARLLVGNEALRRRGGVDNYPYLYDLGTEWYQWTNLPLVLARWMIRKDVERQPALMIEDMLYVGMQDWADGLFRSSPARDELLMHPRDVLEYTQGIRYFIGVTEQRSIERFRQYLAQLPTA
jgi:chorismate dehydratase